MLFNKNNNQFNVVCETEVSKRGLINPRGKLFLLDFLFYRQRRQLPEIDLGDLEFYVLSEEIPRNHDELIELFDNIDKHNGLFKDDVIPQII